MSDAKKTLLPELLPTPRGAASVLPRARVDERARLMLERLRGLKVTAGAAVLAAHTSCYSVVDPLPPPPGLCTSLPDPFADLSTYGDSVATDAGMPNAVIKISTFRAIGFRVDAVRVTSGGTLIRVQDMSRTGLGGGTQFWITVAPDGSRSEIAVFVDFGCGAATTTRHYGIITQADGSFLVTQY